uniref:MgtE domain-containing protein n=1 Tax=Parastrongyloides trichosuri TaxID=131310 RepID=A0A0N4Z9V7_PARTI
MKEKTAKNIISSPKNSKDGDTSSVPYIDASERSNKEENKKLTPPLLIKSHNWNSPSVMESPSFIEPISYLPETFYTESIPDTNLFLEHVNDHDEENAETTAQFVTQSCVTYLITGLAFVLSGLLFEKHKDGTFLEKYPYGFTLAPPLLGLKGNIETTFASRLTTAFHCGRLKKRKAARTYFCGNMALVQIQSVVVSIFIVICACIATVLFKDNAKVDLFFLEQMCVLMAAAIISTSLCSLFLGFILFAIMKYSKEWDINPDNFLTPLSASFGDLITMMLFLSSGYLFSHVGNHNNSIINVLIPILIVTIFVIFGSFCGYIAYHEPSSKKVLKNGWAPIVIASAVSNIAGFLLNDEKLEKKGMLLLQPLICGLLGNRVAVQCSRLSSSLHKSKVKYGKFPHDESLASYFDPLSTYFNGDFNSKIAISQIITSVPAQYMFASLSLLLAESYYVTISFYLYYELLSLVLMIILMYVCNAFVHLIWKCKHDPDTVSIPLLTSLTDVLATFGLRILILNIGEGIHVLKANDSANVPCFANRTVA